MMGLSRHPGPATPALLEPALDELAARAMPFALRHALEVLQQRARFALLLVVRQPDLRQALVRRKFTRDRAQVVTLHRRIDARLPKRVDPERGDRDVGSLREPQHPIYAAIFSR